MPTRRRAARSTPKCARSCRACSASQGPAAGVAAFERRLGAEQIAYKASRFCEWSLPERGRPASAAEARAVRAAFDVVAEAALRAPQRLAHRDLQSSNVHVRDGAPPGARIVLLDLQGAWLAPPEYDLVCLLRDSYVELPEHEVGAHLERVRPELPDAPDPETFARRFDLLTLARKGKDHALFHFVARTRGDRRYLRFVPATVRAAAARVGARRGARRAPRAAGGADRRATGDAVRAMIVAAGLGTRLRPLTDLRPKPALPVRGLPLIAYQLALLAQHGVDEVVINLHHLPEQLMEAAQRWCPAGMSLRFSHEPELLDTGGAHPRGRRLPARERSVPPDRRRHAARLRPRRAASQRHRARGAAVTLLLRDDPRAASFGSIGIDAQGCVRRIGSRFDLGGATRAGLYAWVNVVSASALDSLPEREVFGHLDHWIAPRLAAGARDVRAELVAPAACLWEPVGTPSEYLDGESAPAAPLLPRRRCGRAPRRHALRAGARDRRWRDARRGR